MQNNNKSYKIVIIEPSMIISTGLRKLIEMRNEFEVVAVIADDGDKIAQKLLHSIDALSAPADLLDKNELSEREKEILISLAKGKINKEIADLHHISVHTVITHRKNIIRKTGIKSVSGLTVYAILNNLIDINEVE